MAQAVTSQHHRATSLAEVATPREQGVLALQRVADHEHAQRASCPAASWLRASLSAFPVSAECEAGVTVGSLLEELARREAMARQRIEETIVEQGRELQRQPLQRYGAARRRACLVDRSCSLSETVVQAWLRSRAGLSEKELLRTERSEAGARWPAARLAPALPGHRQPSVGRSGRAVLRAEARSARAGARSCDRALVRTACAAPCVSSRITVLLTLVIVSHALW